MGARAVLESIVERFKKAEISLNIIWINMLDGDSKTTAERKADMFNDPRVRQYYDPNKRSGKAVAESLGCRSEVAWDIYLFYEAGRQWSDIPPQPSLWMHQLKDSWADPGHLHTGEDLVRELHMSMKKITSI